MPELPEVETVRAGLAPVMVGARLACVEARRPDLRFPLPERFVERLSGAQVLALSRRAKYLCFTLDTGETLIAHLGMSGRFTIAGGKAAGLYHHAKPPNPAHTHVVFTTDAGAAIAYNDPRRFGYMALSPSAALAEHPFFAALGPEPLSDAFSADHLAQSFAKRAAPVKAALLDQRLVAGLGNIYVCEALYRAGVSPQRPAQHVPARKLPALAAAIKTVLAEAIAAGGSSLRDYAQTNGALGYFQHAFKVYDREGEPCLRPKCAGRIARIVQSGRSSFFCPLCQA